MLRMAPTLRIYKCCMFAVKPVFFHVDDNKDDYFRIFDFLE